MIESGGAKEHSGHIRALGNIPVVERLIECSSPVKDECEIGYTTNIPVIYRLIKEKTAAKDTGNICSQRRSPIVNTWGTSVVKELEFTCSLPGAYRSC